MTNAERMAILGQALFGERWQRAVARALERDEALVRRWLAGKAEPPDEAIAALRVLAGLRCTELSEAIKSTR